MSVRKLATLLCGIVVMAGLASGCGSGENVSSETNLAKVPLPKDTGKAQHAQKSRARGIIRATTSPRLLPNGMPG